MPAVLRQTVSGPLPNVNVHTSGKPAGRTRYPPQWFDESRISSLQTPTNGTIGIREHLEKLRKESSDPRDWALSEGRRVNHRHGVSSREKKESRRPRSATSTLESCFEDTKRHINDFYFKPYYSSEGSRTVVTPLTKRNTTPPVAMTQNRWSKHMNKTGMSQSVSLTSLPPPKPPPVVNPIPPDGYSLSQLPLAATLGGGGLSQFQKRSY